MYDAQSELTDAQVDAADEKLARRYRAEATNHAFNSSTLDGLNLIVHDALLPVCEGLLDRPASPRGQSPVEAEDMRVMLRRLRSSVRTWSSQGRRAYLTHISQFM